MSILKDDYFRVRSKFLLNNCSSIIAQEKKIMNFLIEVILGGADKIYYEFCQAMELMPFWVNYPPLQRGRAPRGTSIPWGEVGEKSIIPNLTVSIYQKDPYVSFVGLPLGGDVRFILEDSLIHLDVKVTGPNDNLNEIVASPHQISGNGKAWDNDGVLNSPVKVIGPRATMNFQPELPPLYLHEGRPLLCLTYFLKAIYKVEEMGKQPLDYFELVSAPNGLLLFDGPLYSKIKGLLIPGKDERSFKKKRTRVRLEPLSRLDGWRSLIVS